jgi:hypothetical protein
MGAVEIGLHVVQAVNEHPNERFTAMVTVQGGALESVQVADGHINGTLTLVPMTLDDLESYRKDSARLAALEAAGVDNWEGYGHAMAVLRGEEDEDY